jgi:hypothetical protein
MRPPTWLRFAVRLEETNLALSKNKFRETKPYKPFRFDFRLSPLDFTLHVPPLRPWHLCGFIQSFPHDKTNPSIRIFNPKNQVPQPNKPVLRAPLTIPPISQIHNPKFAIRNSRPIAPSPSRPLSPGRSPLGVARRLVSSTAPAQNEAVDHAFPPPLAQLTRLYGSRPWQPKRSRTRPQRRYRPRIDSRAGRRRMPLSVLDLPSGGNEIGPENPMNEP